MEEPKWSVIKTQLDCGIFTITLSRPQKFNAFSIAQYEDVRKAFAFANTNSDIKVLTGTGSYFSSGNDLANTFGPIPGLPNDASPEEKLAYTLDVVEEFLASFVTLKKILMVAVNGHAVGVGVTVLPLAEFTYCVEAATFHTPFMSLAQCPEACSTVTFPEIMGPQKAAEFLVLNKKFSAQEAKQARLVSEVFTSFEAMMAHVKETAKTISSYATGALLTAKELIRSPDRTKLLLEVNHREMMAMRARIATTEAAEAIMKFMSREKSSKL